MSWSSEIRRVGREEGKGPVEVVDIWAQARKELDVRAHAHKEEVDLLMGVESQALFKELDVVNARDGDLRMLLMRATVTYDGLPSRGATCGVTAHEVDLVRFSLSISAQLTLCHLLSLAVQAPTGRRTPRCTWLDHWKFGAWLVDR